MRLDWCISVNHPVAPVAVRAPSRAAHYVRMSTENQQYSPENQLEVVRQYAATQDAQYFLYCTNADTHTKIKIHIPIYKALPRTCLALIEHREEAQQRARSRDRAAPTEMACDFHVDCFRSVTSGQAPGEKAGGSVPSKAASKYQLQV